MVSLQRVFSGAALLVVITLAVTLAGTCEYDKSAFTLLRFNLKATGAGDTIQMEVEQSALDKLRELKTKLAIVSIVGPYRTGKSTLLNQLLPSDIPKGVFSVGHTVQPHTEEVSIYIIPPCGLEGSSIAAETSLIFMDTPGLFANNRAAIFDAQLLAILNLVSSVMMYNNVGVIRRAEVEQISHAIDAAFALSYYDDTDGDANHIDRPHLIWCMQNLMLDLKDKEGQDISPKSYIQLTLNEIDASASNGTAYTYKFNKFFASLDSFPLPFPTDSLRDAPKLDKMSDSEFTEEYRKARTLLQGKLMNIVTPKKLGKNLLVGSNLASLLQAWVENINLPLSNVRSTSASTLLKHINQKEVGKALEKYKAEMRKITFPVPDSQLAGAHAAAVALILANVNTNDLPDFVASIQTETNTLYTAYIALNENNAKGVLEEQIKIAEDSYNSRAKAWTYPSTQERILAMEEDVMRLFHASIDPVRSAAAALITLYEQKLVDSMILNRANMLQSSAFASKELIGKQFQSKVSEIKMPQSESVFQEAADASLQEWRIVENDLSKISESAMQPIKIGFNQVINDALTSALARNLEASIHECTEQAKKVAYEILSKSQDWISDHRFKSYNSFEVFLQHIKSQPFCNGPGRNSSAVEFQFSRVHHDVNDEIEQRVIIANVWFGMSAAISLVCAWSLRAMLTAKRGEGVKGIHTYVGVIAGILAAGDIFIWLCIPDATSNGMEMILQFLLGTLSLTFIVSLYNAYKLCAYGKVTAHEH